jgi:DNA-binding response OmpR family regulator
MTRILVIDDSRVMRDMLSDFLVDNGFEVVAVEHPADGFTHAREQEFDLCICDMHLIGTNGLEVVTRLTSEFPDLRCIITDSLPDENSDQIRLDRNHLYIRKPFELSQIRDLIQTALTRIRIS